MNSGIRDKSDVKDTSGVKHRPQVRKTDARCERQMSGGKDTDKI